MLEGLILLALGVWLALALRSCLRSGGCGGDCSSCAGCVHGCRRRK